MGILIESSIDKINNTGYYYIRLPERIEKFGDLIGEVLKQGSLGSIILKEESYLKPIYKVDYNDGVITNGTVPEDILNKKISLINAKITGIGKVITYEIICENDHYLRATGRTTRIIDQCVQEIFKNGYTIFKDHYDTDKSNMMLAEKIINRVKMEHNIDLKVNKLMNGFLQINLPKNL